MASNGKKAGDWKHGPLWIPDSIVSTEGMVQRTEYGANTDWHDTRNEYNTGNKDGVKH